MEIVIVSVGDATISILTIITITTSGFKISLEKKNLNLCDLNIKHHGNLQTMNWRTCMKSSRLKKEKLTEIYERILSFLTYMGITIISLLLWYGFFKLLSKMI